MNLGHPFLIYGLCKKVGVPLKSNEAWIHPIKAIVVRKKKPGVPRPEEVYDFGNEPSDEEELRAYQATYGGRHDERGEVGQSSTQPPPPTTPEEDDPISLHPIKDQVIGVNRISIYSVFLRCLCNLNVKFSPLCVNITLTPHLCEFCRDLK